MKGEPATLGGNRLFLVCTACGADTASAFELARRGAHGYRAARALSNLGNFLERHASCGGTRDHFKLGMSHTAEYDVPKARAPIDAVVHQAVASA